MNILVTGSSGYVGSNFINTYKDKYNFITFSLQKDSIDNINLNNIDVILHCAALVHQKIEYSYEKYYEINVKYPYTLAKRAKENGVKQFIFMSTVAVYGIEIGIMNEDSDCNPISDYGKSKYKAELELQKIEDDSFKVSIIRPPIVNGYNAPGNMKSLINLVNKVPILPFGNIQNRRSMVYVGNLCHMIDVLIESRMTGKLDYRASLAMTEGVDCHAVTESVFLASDDEAISTTRLIELIADGLGKKVYLIKIPFFESLLKLVKLTFHKRLYGSLEVDNSKTKKLLDFKNLYSVEDGIKFMINGER